MEWWQIVLCVLINGVLFVPITYELITAAISDYKRNLKHKKMVQEKNREYIELYGMKKRRLCVECSYCRWKWHHPFSRYGKYRGAFVTKNPYYCRKFKKSLPQNTLLTCISELHSEAMYEKDM